VYATSPAIPPVRTLSPTVRNLAIAQLDNV
jgi:hypothetical protein